MTTADFERYWDARARENALYYVDNELDYASPDVDAFWRGGDAAVQQLCDLVELTIAPDEVIVDIGCGVGRLTRALAARARLVYGIDVSGEMLALAQRYNAELTNVRWTHGDGHSLAAIDDAVATGCFSHVVFQHIPDPAITLNYVRDMGRVLVPGGWALFVVSTDPRVHRPPPRRAPRLPAWLRRQAGTDDERAWWGSAVEADALRAAAQAGGMLVERLLGEGTQFTVVLARRGGAPQARLDAATR